MYYWRWAYNLIYSFSSGMTKEGDETKKKTEKTRLADFRESI